MLTVLLAAGALFGCGSDSKGADEPTATKPSASTLAAEASAVGTTASDTDDPLAALLVVAASLPTTEPRTTIAEILSARESARKVEQYKVERELSVLQGALARTCEVESLGAAFEPLAAAEASSLANERDLLRGVLDALGAPGRDLVWQLSDPETLFLKGRVAQASGASATLPAWSALQLDGKEELRVRRLLLGMQFAVEGVRVETDAQFAAFASEIKQVKPGEADAVDRAVAALELVDAQLLASQRARYELLPAACVGLGDEAWVSMLERGFVRRFIGTLGGTGGTDEDAAGSSVASRASAAASASRTGQGAGAQAGGQQMGGAQAGGQQMGGAQAGGQQRGGQQMGGAQSGGQQMGGQQTGGAQTGGQQMGGQQMGGAQTGGGQQMGGAQTGGKQQGGAQQGGQQMGGQQMGGSQQGASGGAGQGGAPQNR